MANPATKLSSSSMSGCRTDILRAKTASKISVIPIIEIIEVLVWLFFIIDHDRSILNRSGQLLFYPCSY